MNYTKVKLKKSYDDDFGDTVFELKISEFESPHDEVEIRIVEFYEGVFGTINVSIIGFPVGPIENTDMDQITSVWDVEEDGEECLEITK